MRVRDLNWMQLEAYLSGDDRIVLPVGYGIRPGGFEHGGWSVNYWDGAMGEWMEQSMGQPFDRVLDRKTYEIFAAHWPYLTRLEAVDTVHC